MNRYRFPRTLDEAFGPDAYSACAITRYRPSRLPKLLLWAIFAVGIAALVWRI